MELIVIASNTCKDVQVFYKCQQADFQRAWDADKHSHTADGENKI